ncbi:uncharacterized protein [Antedon mediterranea]|uniref:uncharacterized protein n=1 Tax=Antedon mediterranea TaxID=105859 RepID=UPI003AF9B3B4
MNLLIGIVLSGIVLSVSVFAATESCTAPEALGVEQGTAELTASSEYNYERRADRGRLNMQHDGGGRGGWTAGAQDNNQWIQADLLEINKVTGVITQGRSHASFYVTSYKVLYTTDISLPLQNIVDEFGSEAAFPGNSDSNTQVTNTFYQSVLARFIRINPTGWSGHVSLRFEVIGCKVATTANPTTATSTTANLTTATSTTANPTTATSTTANPTTATSTTANLTTATSTTANPTTATSTTANLTTATSTTANPTTATSTTANPTTATPTTSIKTTSEPLPSTAASTTEILFLSADGNIAGQTLSSWMASKEVDIVHALRSTESDVISFEHQSVYSKASWIGKTSSVVHQEIKTANDKSVFFSVKVSPNEENYIVVPVLVSVYFERDVVANGPDVYVDYDHTTNDLHDGDDIFILISGLLSISIYGINDTLIAGQVELSLPINPFNESSEYIEKNSLCVFYDIKSSKWSTRGCQMLNYNSTTQVIHCFCSHMTSFAVLMQVSDDEVSAKDDVINSWITIIGLSLSVVTLIICLLVYVVLRCDKMSVRHKIHVNLIVCMLGVDLLFLTAINKTEQKSCKFVAILLHYLIFCMFMWMLAEACFLVIKVIKNASNKLKLMHYMLFCYLTPACFIGVFAAVRYDCYVTETMCWLRSSCRLVFAIPALLIVGVNIVVLAKMVYVIYKRSGPMLRKPPKIQKEYKQLRTAVRGSFVLLPILGVTWVLGAFANASLFVVYLFNILNSLQGVFVFVVCCLLDNEICGAGKKWMAKHFRWNNKIKDLSTSQGTKSTNAMTAAGHSTVAQSQL